MDALRRVVHALHASSRWAERRVGLTAAQLFVVQVLGDAPGLSLNELAARTHTHQSSVSTVVSRLVAAGLVSRGRSPQDSRRVVLRLTAKGRRLAGAAPDPVQGRLIEGIERLPSARRAALAQSLNTLTEAMQIDEDAPAMFFHHA